MNNPSNYFLNKNCKICLRDASSLLVLSTHHYERRLLAKKLLISVKDKLFYKDIKTSFQSYIDPRLVREFLRHFGLDENE